MILNRRTASIPLALMILGLKNNCTESEGRVAYRLHCLVHHPDRGGTHEEFILISSAWTFLKAAFNWCD
jgi:curved DNA-binding protein CbpA